MASTLRVGLQKGIQYKEIVNGSLFTLTRFIHGFALPPSMDSTLSPPLTLPHQSDSDYSCQYPGFAPGGGSMDLTAVPKKNVHSFLLLFIVRFWLFLDFLNFWVIKF